MTIKPEGKHWNYDIIWKMLPSTKNHLSENDSIECSKRFHYIPTFVKWIIGILQRLIKK